jgi:outer membrane protein
MRTFFHAASLALVLATISGGRVSAQGGLKIAYITSNILLDQAPGRAEAEAQFDKETAIYRGEIKRMSDSLNAMVAAFEKRQAGLSPALRDAQNKEIQGKEASYQTRTRELQEKANQRQSELVGPILDRIKLAIEDVRVEGGYSFVFNADQGSALIAMDKNLNVTDRVLAKLRSAPAAPASKVPVAGAPTPSPSGVTRPVTPPLD